MSSSYSRLDDVNTRNGCRFALWSLLTIGGLFLLVQLLQRSDTPSWIDYPSPRRGIMGSAAEQSGIFKAFYDCVYPKMSKYRGDYEKFWFNFVNETMECDELEAYKTIDLRSVKNHDETKYVAYPKTGENITMVTLGIGHDTDGEEALKVMYPNTEFFGVDPIPEINKDLYEKLGGTYFPVAISGVGGMQKSHVYRTRYANEITLHIGAGYFFEEMLKQKKIDILWIDTEGNEYTFIDLLHNGEEFERRGIKICQMNIEMHKETFKGWSGEKQKFHDFVFRVLSEGKYIMMKPYWVTYYNKGFIRTFLVNVQDEECVGTFLS